MYVLRIEHPVPDYDSWKTAFESDPVGRERSGVRRYRILRPTDDPNYVMIDLEFDSESESEALLAAMRKVWGRVDVMRDPRRESSRWWRAKSTNPRTSSTSTSILLPRPPKFQEGLFPGVCLQDAAFLQLQQPTHDLLR